MSWKQKKKNETLLAREQGCVKKVWGAGYTVCLAYPHAYRIGMANLGFQSVYQMINASPFFLCERAFLPAQGDGAESIACAAEIVSLENRKPLSEFDILAFSISFENDYPSILKMLEAAGIPLLASSRDERHPLVIGGGIAPTLNPEPLADFFDGFLLGEAEALLPRFMDLFAKSSDRDATRHEILIDMQKSLPGAYVPSLYAVSYLPDGPIKRIEPLRPDLPFRIEVFPVSDLSAFCTEECVSAPDTEMGDMYLIEVNRGCPRRCLFCAAGHVYAPVRFRRLDSLRPAIDRGLAIKKKIGLVGTAVSDHPDLLEICRYILAQGGKAGIGSLRADRVTPDIVDILKASGIETVALAPEAGSQRLRDAIRKDLSEVQILDAVCTLLDSGIDQLRLYFMVGLPDEEESDVDAIIDLALKIRQEALDRFAGKKKFRRITLSVNQFIPKPRTPYERCALADIHDVSQKIQRIASAFKRDKQIHVIHDVPKWNYVQALLSLGDRRTGEILLSAHRLKGNWPRALRAVSFNADFHVYRNKPKDELLPWDHIEIMNSKR